MMRMMRMMMTMTMLAYSTRRFNDARHMKGETAPLLVPMPMLVRGKRAKNGRCRWLRLNPHDPTKDRNVT